MAYRKSGVLIEHKLLHNSVETKGIKKQYFIAHFYVVLVNIVVE